MGKSSLWIQPGLLLILALFIDSMALGKLVNLSISVLNSETIYCED